MLMRKEDRSIKVIIDFPALSLAEQPGLSDLRDFRRDFKYSFGRVFDRLEISV